MVQGLPCTARPMIRGPADEATRGPSDDLNLIGDDSIAGDNPPAYFLPCDPSIDPCNALWLILSGVGIPCIARGETAITGHNIGVWTMATTVIVIRLTAWAEGGLFRRAPPPAKNWPSTLCNIVFNIILRNVYYYI